MAPKSTLGSGTARTSRSTLKPWSSEVEQSGLGPGGKVVFLTNETVDKPLAAFDAYDDRSLIEHCCIKESKQAWNLKLPPRRPNAPCRCTCSHPGDVCTCHGVPLAGRAGGGRGRAYGLAALAAAIIQQNRDKVIIFAQGWYGIFHVAEYSLLLGVRLQRTAPGGRKSSRRAQEIRAHGTCV